MSAQDAGWPLGTITVLGAHILDVLGRPVETIPPGQGIENLGQVLDFLSGPQPTVAGRIKEHM